MTSPVSLEEVLVYLEKEDDEDGQVASALAAETAAQERKCRIDNPIQPDLKEALCRRVARNLALRQLPIMVMRGDAESGPLVAPGSDAEVRRLEAPHRKLILG